MKYFLCTSIFFFLSCNLKHNSDEAIHISQLVKEKNSYIKEKDSLLLKLSRLENNYWFQNEYEGEKFKKKGWEDPEKEIETELRKRLDLIPLSAVLGGKMNFERIQLLSNQWIMASYSDGHVSGRALYEFYLNENSRFEFKIFKSQID